MPRASRSNKKNDATSSSKARRTKKTKPLSKPLKRPLNSLSAEMTKTVENGPNGFSTDYTFDKLIYPDAQFTSFEHFEECFNEWREKYQHPFRVASSESLRTENGEISEKFKYRYVVYHCARYGEPRIRGEGKRPNQNYLPCSCNAMLRLNFSFKEQCMKVTSMETRHSNHALSEALFKKQMEKEAQRMKMKERKRLEAGGAEPEHNEQEQEHQEMEEEEEHEDEGEDGEAEEVSSEVIGSSGIVAPIPIKLEPTSIVSDFYAPAAPLLPKLEASAPAPFNLGALPPLPCAPLQVPNLPDLKTIVNLPQFQSQFPGQFSMLPLPQHPFSGAPWTLNHIPPPAMLPTPTIGALGAPLAPGALLLPGANAPGATAAAPNLSPSHTNISDENEAPLTYHHLDAPAPAAPAPKAAPPNVTQVLNQMTSLIGPGVPADVLHGRVHQLVGLMSSWCENLAPAAPLATTTTLL